MDWSEKANPFFILQNTLTIYNTPDFDFKTERKCEIREKDFKTEMRF